MAASLAHDYFSASIMREQYTTGSREDRDPAWGNDPAICSVPSRRKCVKSDLRNQID
jgi:hypothetical protein